VDEAIERVIREYQVGREQARVDVSAFLERLSAAGLIETQQPG
jgi:hypothetical protein